MRNNIIKKSKITKHHQDRDKTLMTDLSLDTPMSDVKIAHIELPSIEESFFAGLQQWSSHYYTRKRKGFL